MKGIRALMATMRPDRDSLSEKYKKIQRKTLNDRNKQIALLVALGWRNKDIAAEMGMLQQNVSIIRGSPVVLEQIEKYRQAIDEKAISEGVVKRLHGEFHASMDKLVELRDGGEEETTQLGAAKFLVDKAVDAIVPKKSQVEETKKVGVVILGAEDVGRLQGVLDELKVLEEAEIVDE